MIGIEASQPARFQRRGATQDRIVHGHQGDSLQDLVRPAQRSLRITVRATQRPAHFDANEAARDAIFMHREIPA